MPEFVGTTVLDTIGLVIASVDPELRKKMKIKENYRSVGIISSRTGAAGQITAVDDAVKETNTEVLSIMLPRDTKGWGGHGNYIVIGAETVADARRAVEIALEKTKRNAGEIYVSDARTSGICLFPTGGSGTWFCLRHSQRKSLWICLRISGSDRFCHGGSGGESSRCGHRKIYDAG